MRNLMKCDVVALAGGNKGVSEASDHQPWLKKVMVVGDGAVGTVLRYLATVG